MWERTHGHGPEGLAKRAGGMLAIAVMAVLITAALPCTASAATVFSSISPVPDSVLVGSPDSLRAYVQADSAVLTTSKIAVDGVDLTTYVDWPGHWEDPTCQEVWIIDDYSKGTISANKAEGFSAGTHTAVLTVNTASSGSSTYTWSFTVTYPANQLATFSARNPAANTTATSPPMVRVTVESTNAISGYNADLFVDGTIVNHTYSALSTKKFNLYTLSAIAMTDGLHTVRATVLDALRIPSEDSWSFKVAIKPTLNSPEPSSGATVHVARPPIRVIIADNTPGPLRMVLRLDGVQKFDGMVPQGTFRWDPTADFANGSTHTVRADVYDAAGNTQTLTWSFTATAAAPMSTGNDCTSCHQAATHPFNNCTGCHQSDPLYDPHGPNRYAPAGPCYDCHGSSYTHTISPDCAYCHSSTQWVQIPRHTPSEEASKHVSAASGCDMCHDTSLLAEHGKYPSKSVFKYQCELCHTSARPEVIAAITANDTSCGACHANAGHPHPEAAITGVLAGDGRLCTECHSSDIIVEHAKTTSAGNADPCATCHAASGGGGARSAIGGAWDRTCDTPACHGASSAQPVHSTYCQGCHQNENTDFSVKQTDFSGASVAKAKCKSCHGTGITDLGRYKLGRRWYGYRHLSHDATAECKSCHFWEPVRTEFYTQAVTGPYGAFASVDSTSPTAARAHSAHTSGSWPKSIEFAPQIYCGNCHEAVGCASCHGEAGVPAAHASHGTQPTSTVSVARGAASYTSPKAALVPETRSCTAAACHGSDAATVPTCASCHTDRTATHW